jgi:D-alanyl-D-alanine carboxypeptidase
MTYWPTVTRQVLSAAESAGLGPCQNRTVPADFLVFATQQFTLPESYIPPNMVLTTDYFDSSVTLDNPQFIRQTILEPLQRMIGEMHSLDLRPSIISAYRSYQEQALAWHWWNGQYPDRVAILSARPGHSEHQLGTTIDFGSPEIRHLFNVDFVNTSEGVWLRNNAYRFGFTLSYPVDSYPVTGYKHEPWHYRYVGVEMAEYLYNAGQLLTSWQITNLSPPCIP